MGKQREKEGKQRKSRGPRWALWETLLACHVVIDIRNKFAQGMGGPELIREYARHNGPKKGEEERGCVFTVKKTRIYVHVQLLRNSSSTRVVNTRP